MEEKRMNCSSLVSVNSSEQLNVCGGLTAGQLKALLQLLIMIAQWLAQNISQFGKGLTEILKEKK